MTGQAIQSNVDVTLLVAPQTDLWTPAATGDAATTLRRISSGLTPTKASFTSNEVRQDQQISDMRHGMRSGRGPIAGELSCVSYDAFLGGAMRNVFTNGVSAAPADFATGVTGTTPSAGVAQLDFAGAGSLITKGFKVGDVVRLSGLTGGAAVCNGLNLRVTAVTSVRLTAAIPEDSPFAAFAQVAAGWTLRVQGRKAINGLLKPAFTVEQLFGELSASELFTGVRVGAMSLNAPPTAIADVSFDLTARDFDLLDGDAGDAASPYFTAPAAQGASSLMAGVDGAIRMRAGDRGIVTGFSLNLNQNVTETAVVGSKVTPDLFYGRAIVTGQVTALLDSFELMRAFVDEEEIDLSAMFQSAPVAGAQDFVSFSMQRVKLSAGSHQIGADGGVVAQFPFQALLKAGGSGTAYDQTTLAIQQST